MKKKESMTLNNEWWKIAKHIEFELAHIKAGFSRKEDWKWTPPITGLNQIFQTFCKMDTKTKVSHVISKTLHKCGI